MNRKIMFQILEKMLEFEIFRQELKCEKQIRQFREIQRFDAIFDN